LDLRGPFSVDPPDRGWGSFRCPFDGVDELDAAGPFLLRCSRSLEARI
jgi:hypothetical protein